MGQNGKGSLRRPGSDARYKAGWDRLWGSRAMPRAEILRRIEYLEKIGARPDSIVGRRLKDLYALLEDAP